MTRKCFMRGCENGNLSKRAENIRLGIREKCLFKLPKCPELKKKWCQALELQESRLGPNHVICEDHFNAKDVIKYDITHLPDGTRLLLERGSYRLDPKAVPCIKAPWVRFNGAKTYQPLNIDLTKEVQTRNDTPREHSNPVVDPDAVARPIEIEQIEKRYSFEELVKDMKRSCSSSRWGSVLNVDSIDFLNWDASNFRLAMVLRVFRDLKMKFYTADKYLIKSLDTVPKSYAEFLQNLMLLEKTILCDGNGLNNRRSKQCLGEVGLSELRRQGRVWKRCQPCSDLRKKELEKQQEVKRDMQRRLNITNCKNIRLKVKVNKLKEDVERAKKKCAEIQEKSLDERIGVLPPPIQDSVSTCFQAPKVKPSGRRYTMKWIYECMLIRMKSRKIYEYLRTHSILPLPCIDTLDRYMEKMNTPRTDESISNCSGEKLAPAMATEESDSPILDDVTVTERLDSDKSEILKKLEEMKKNTKIIKL